MNVATIPTFVSHIMVSASSAGCSCHVPSAQPLEAFPTRRTSPVRPPANPVLRLSLPVEAVAQVRDRA
jgi:hypothetical protein